jgi:5-(carboxyamino)imidazole ribonucleotide synthase
MKLASLPPGSTLGILGDGQLGRMLALAARQMGYDVHVLGPTGIDSPAGRSPRTRSSPTTMTSTP